MTEPAGLLETIRAFYAYDCWATGHVLDVAEGLAPEQWLAPGQAGHGSIRDTLVHIIAARRGWLSWWDGSMSANDAYSRVTNPAGYPDVAAVRAFLEEVERQTQAFLGRLTEAELRRVFVNTLPNGQTFRLELWKMMLHIANHGTQHRSEAAAMLTEHGRSPGSLDMVWFFRPFGDAPAG